MKSLLSEVKLATHSGARPPVAVEFTPQGVMAASLPAPGQPPVYAFEPLPAGVLIPGIAEANLRAPEIVAKALHYALGRVAPRTRSVTVIVPDTVVRVFVLDFDSLPASAAEAIPILRFRLRKSLPFDVEHAGIGYQILVQTKTECKVLVAVLPGPILAEYEAVVRASGYEPGAVLSTSLAALGALDATEATLIANLSALSLTTAITTGTNLLLYRTLELPEDPSLRRQEVQRAIAVAVAYFEDTLFTRPQRLKYDGEYDAQFFSDWLDSPSLIVDEMVPTPESGTAKTLNNASIAGVIGALAGAM